MSNKFIRSIAGSADGIKLQRVTVLATQAKLAQETLINDIKRKHASLELQLNQLVDLAPDSSDSLRPGQGFNPVTWALAVQDIKISIKTNLDALAIAEGTYNEWFSEPVAAATNTIR